ncbi:MAG: I78 family peptidase inhibitor [Pseudomonadota bacterium]
MRFTIPAAALLILAACASDAPDDRDVNGGSDLTNQALPGPSEVGGSGELAELEQCDAQNYRILLGTDVEDTDFPVGPRLRVFGANDIVTQDYIPQRTNVVHDNSGEVIRVYCG